MTLHVIRRATNVACALAARMAAYALAWAVLSVATLGARARETDNAPVDEPPVVDMPVDDAGPALIETDQPAFTAPTAPEPPAYAEPLLAPLGEWEQPLEPDSTVAGNVPLEEKPPLRPFDWIHHWGFHHSSTEGRFLDRGLPMERSSWLNRPYHVDWFAGPLLSTGPVDGRVEQGNELFGGLRIGWDFDYYWGVEWRFGWSDPTLLATLTSVNDDGDTVFTDVEFNGNYFVSDIDFVYYPWGDTKVRPYALLGLGMAQVGSVRADGTGQEATLLGMPMGIGVHFPQTHWLTWRLEIIDNLAWGAEGVDTLNNFAFTAGMELRLGARPNSYWPWRSSRTIW
jgi:hypothetical protein